MNNKRNLAFVIPSIAYGGAEIQTINHVNYLHEHGFPVYLIVLGSVTDNALFKRIKLDKQLILVLQSGNNTLSAKSVVRTLPHLHTISRFISANKINTVVANLPIAHFVMRLVKVYRMATFKKPFLLVQYHRSMQYEANPLNTFGKRFFNSVNSFLAYLTDDKNIFISKAALQNISKRFFVRKPVVIYDSVPLRQVSGEVGLQYLRDHGLVRKKMILLPGRIHPAKGQLEFLEVYKRFLITTGATKEDLLLLLAGGGDQRYTEALVNKIQQLGLQDFVYVTGSIENELMLSFFKISDFAVIPSISEGLGNVAIEGLMQGSLILASDSGGLKEVIIEGRNGVSYPSGDESLLLEKMIMLYNGSGSIPVEQITSHYYSNYTLDAQMEKILPIITNV